MVQSLYAFLAIMMVTTFSLTQRGVIYKSQYNSMVNDVDLIGIGIATEQLDFIASKPFDANYPVADSSFLTPPGSFGLGSSDYMTSLDIDDFHNKTLALKKAAFNDSLSFEIQVQVHYVNKAGASFTPHSSQTNYKEVKVTVNGEGISSVNMARIFTYH